MTKPCSSAPSFVVHQLDLAAVAGMIIRAAVSVVWREHMNRTIAEEFERPLAALVTLTRSASLEEHQIVAAEMVIITGVQAMLTVATDAQLEGRSAGIDARNLVERSTRRAGSRSR